MRLLTTFNIKRSFLLILTVGWVVSFFIPSKADAAGAIEAQRRQAQERQAQQQALQRQAYQNALRQQMLQKQMVDQQRQQQIEAYKKQLSRKQQVMYQEAVKREIAQQRLAAGSVPAPLQETSGGVLIAGSTRGKGRPDEVIDIYDLWDEFKHSSEAWGMMMDRQPKLMTVRKYIDYYRKQGVQIRKPADHYVDMIDGMAKGSPEMLQQPFDKVLQFVSIMEYDFDNGMNRDELARRVLGEKFYQQNRKRLGR